MTIANCRRDAPITLPPSRVDWRSDDVFAIYLGCRDLPQSAFWLWHPALARIQRLTFSYPEEAALMARVINNRPAHWWRPPNQARIESLACYQLAPHTALAFGKGLVVCGQMAGLDTCLLDTTTNTYASLCNNPAGEWAYCPTPGLSADRTHVLTARWPIYSDQIQVDDTHYSEIVRIDPTAGTEAVLTRVAIADSIHQVAPLPDGTHVLLNEFRTGLNDSVPDLTALDPHTRLGVLRRIGVTPSRVGLLDLRTGECTMWTCPCPAPAHIVVDPDDPSVFYLACHNMVIHKGQMYLLGPGCLIKAQIVDGQIQMVAHYGHPKLYRASTHQLVRYRGRKAIAVTVYPNRCELIDTESFTCLLAFDLFPIVTHDERGTTIPDYAAENAFSVCATGTPDVLALSGSRRLYIADLRSDTPHIESVIYNDDPNWTTRGHMAQIA